jgi:predicted nucleotidyltransferase
MKHFMEHTLLAQEERGILIRCRDVIKEIDTQAELILYGSRARGDAAHDSDYDLLIVSDGPATLAREDTFRRRLYSIELDTGAVLTVILVNRDDWNSALYDTMPFYRNIKREGVVL